MAVFVGEPHDLVFDRGAVAGALAVDEAAVDRCQVQVVANQLVGGGGGAGDVAAHRLAAHPGGRIEGEEAVVGVAGLLFERIERHAAPVHPGGGACFEPVRAEAQGLQRFGEPFGRLFAGAARRHRLAADPDAAAQKGAGGEDHRLSGVDAAEVGAHPDHPADRAAGLGAVRLVSLGGLGRAVTPVDLAVEVHLQIGHHRLAQGEVGGVLEQLQHLAGVGPLVRLGAQGPDGRAAAGVENAFLQGGGVRQAADDAAEGIHLMHQLALGGPAHGRVAGLPGNAIEVEREQGGVQAQPGGGERRFAAGVAAADHDQIKAFGGGAAQDHRPILHGPAPGRGLGVTELAPDGRQGGIVQRQRGPGAGYPWPQG